MKSIFGRPQLVIALASAAFLLAACGDKILDYRNAQFNNGKVYAGDENSPFSGTLTNVGTAQVLGGQDGFGRLLNVIKYDVPNATVGMTGLSSICDVHVKDGLLDGKATCKTSQSDTIRIAMTFKNGVLDDEFVIYDATGKDAFVKALFRNAMPDGEQKIYNPDSHQAVFVNIWDNGKISEEYGYYPDGKLQSHVKRLNGQYDGDLDVYAPDGKQLVHRVTYVTGKKQGPDDSYAPATGKHTVHADWEDNRLNGVVTTWDTSGAVVKQETYVHGVRLESAEESRPRCCR